MKICFIMYQGNMYSGGQGVYLYYLTRELARMGHEVHVLAGPPYPELAENVIGHNLETHSYWSYHYEKAHFLFERNPLSHFHPVNFYEFVSTRIALSSLLLTFSVRAWLKLRELSREHRFDIVHDNQTLSYGISLMQASGFPVIATIHHPLTIDLQNALRQSLNVYRRAQRLLWYPWYMQRMVARRLDRIITGSDNSARSVREAFSLAPGQVRVISDGVDSDVFRPLGLAREPNSVLFVGNSEEYSKGVRYLLEALGYLKGKREIHLTVVDQPLGDLVGRLSRQLGLEAQVTVTGRVGRQELVRLYNRAQLLVSPSLYEGFGLPAAEAMACETPVIATTAGAFPEVIEDGVSGLLVPPGDSEELADAVDRLLGDESRRRALGTEARIRILERFTWSETARQTSALYREVIEGSRCNGTEARRRELSRQVVA